MAGQISVPDDFDRMGKEEIEEIFGGSVILIYCSGLPELRDDSQDKLEA